MKHNILILLLMVFLIPSLSAQDEYPLNIQSTTGNLNPTYTDIKNESFRLRLMYGENWRNVLGEDNYKRIAVDMDYMYRVNKSDYITTGVLINQHAAGMARLTHFHGKAKFAFHKSLVNNRRQGVLYLAAGASIGADRVTSTRNHQYSVQFDGEQFDATIPSNEIYWNANARYLDLGTGLSLSYSKENHNRYKRGAMIGVSAYHLNQPNVSLDENREFVLPYRYSIMVNFNFDINNQAALKSRNVVHIQGQNNFLNSSADLHFSVDKQQNYVLIAGLGLTKNIKDNSQFSGYFKIGFEGKKAGIVGVFGSSLSPMTAEQYGNILEVMLTARFGKPNRKGSVCPRF